MWKLKTLRFPEIIFAIALILLLFWLGTALFEYARLAWAALSFPFPLDYGEGPILDQTLRLAHLENIYRNDFSSPPYTVSNYPPLFQLLQVPFSWIFGPAYWYGRLISILSAITAAVLIALILHALTHDWIASSIGGLTLLTFPYITQWSIYNRVDTLALAFSMGGLYAIVRRPESPRAPWISGLLFTAAVYTRQSYLLAGPLAAFLWLLHIKQRRQAVKLAAIVAGTSLGLFLFLNLLTRGGFYMNTVLANLNPFSWYSVTRYVFEIYVNVGFLVIAGVLFLIAERLGEPTRSWPLVIFYLAGAILSALLVGKAGSNFNYMYEAVAWLCLVTGAIIAWPGKNTLVKGLIIFLLALQINGLVNWSREEFIPKIMTKIEDSREVSQLAQLVQGAQGTVLADEYMGLLPLYGRRIYFQPFEFMLLKQANLWDEDALIQSIQAEEFPAILLYLPSGWNSAIVERWLPGIRSSIYDHYDLDKIRAETLIYLPKEKNNSK